MVDAATPWGEIEKSLQHASPLLQAVALFDLFTSTKLGADKKSFAFSLTFASAERTLESAEVDAAIQKILKALHERFGALPR